MTTLLQRILEEIRPRNLFPDTKRSVIHCIANFVEYFNMSPEIQGVTAIRKFRLHLLTDRKSVV